MIVTTWENIRLVNICTNSRLQSVKAQHYIYIYAYIHTYIYTDIFFIYIPVYIHLYTCTYIPICMLYSIYLSSYLCVLCPIISGVVLVCVFIYNIRLCFLLVSMCIPICSVFVYAHVLFYCPFSLFTAINLGC